VGSAQGLARPRSGSSIGGPVGGRVATIPAMAAHETPPNRWDPALYRERASFVHRIASDLVGVLAPLPGERVLDLGCGTGELTSAIAAAGASVVGLDASEEMIAAARRRGPDLTFVVGDGEALEYEAEFDAVFSNAALHWMRRADAAAMGMARALRPGGRLVAEFGGKGCIATVRSAIEDVLRRMDEEPHLWLRWYFPDVAEYVGVLAAAGLDVTLAHRFDRPTPLEGEGALRDWLRLFLAPLAAHLGARWELFAREVESACRRALRRDEGWVLDYVRLRVVAWRARSPA
jgi:trans-aconitate methyltransferase